MARGIEVSTLYRAIIKYCLSYLKKYNSDRARAVNVLIEATYLYATIKIFN